MPRRPARRAVAVAGVALALLSGAALPDGTADAAGVTSSAEASTTATWSTAGTAVEPVGRTPYETRLLRARKDHLDLEAVVGGRDRPNVLVLMTDDMRDDDLKFMPKTRELIGEQGVRFVNSFSPYPLCCPARASFLSGRYTHNHGVFSNVSPYAFQAFDDRRALPVWLQRAGYRTTYIGKYLNGYGGQETYDGLPSQRYVPPGWTDWRGAVKNAPRASDAANPLSGSPYQYFDTTLNDNGVLEPNQGRYQTFLYGDLAQDMVHAAARGPAPFLGVVSFTAPHDGKPVEEDDLPAGAVPGDGVENAPSPARPDYVKGRFTGRILGIPGGEDPRDRLDEKPGFMSSAPPLTAQAEALVLTRYTQRAESLAVVDDEIANILAALERTGELDNTYVLFTSDNGYFAGEHRRTGGKKLAYEPSLRVPMLVRGPGIPAGEVRTDPFLILDIAPTIRDMAGLPPDRSLDGVSLLDVARGGDRGWRRSVLVESGPRAVPDGSRTTMPLEVDGVLYDVRYSLGVRTRRYLYVEHTLDGPELYDLVRDPRQRVNLAAIRRARSDVGRLQRLLVGELERLGDCAGASCSAPAPAALTTGPVAPPWVPLTLSGEDGALDSVRNVSHIR